jgi:hypothetical protein
MAVEGTSLLKGPAVVVEQSADEQKVQEVFQVGGGASAQELVGNGFTYRHDWGDRNGQHILHLNWGAINNNSRVFVSISEGQPGGGKFIGSARYTLYNVAPSNGRVSIWINIEWSSPIRLSVDYLVINP